MLNQNGGSRTDTLIKLVLVFFLSLLSFSVGTFVGKQFSDSQHKIAELENNGSGNEGERETASIPPDVAKVEPNQAISEDEISKLSEEFVKKEKQEIKPAADTGTAHKKTEHDEEGKRDEPEGLKGKVVAEEKAEKHENTETAEAVISHETTPSKEAKAEALKTMASVHDEIAKVSQRIANGEKVEAPKQKQPRIPTSLPKELANSSIGRFTVQVSAHIAEEEAKSKTQELQDKGFSAIYLPALINGKTWYRVNVGQFDRRTDALAQRSKLEQAGVPSPIVTKIQK